MKKRILIVLSALLVFGLVAVAFAYNRSRVTPRAADSHCAMENCCEGGKCKMDGACCAKHKNETASSEKKDACCGMADCCRDGKCSMGGACCKNHDSCSMKDKETATAASVDLKNVVVAGEAESCCASGSACCNGGACCKKEKSAS